MSDRLSDQMLRTIAISGMATRATAVAMAEELLQRRLDQTVAAQDRIGTRLHKLENNLILAQGVGAFFGEFLGKYLRPQEPMPWFHLGTSDEHVPPRASE